jgi:hypothetical protein
MPMETPRAKATETIANKTDIVNQSRSEHPEITYWNNIIKSVPKAPDINPEMLELFNKNKRFFRRFAIGRRAVTLHYDTKDYENLVETYFNEDSPIYKPRYAKLIDKTTPILKFITAETARLTPRI